ncbi:MAG: ATP-grasp domain-containing protein [Bacteroidota bacterium]
MTDKVSVAILYSQIGEEEYEQMIKKARRDPDLSLDVRAQITTVDEQMRTLAKALAEAGFRSYAVNINDRFGDLLEALTHNPPDVVFNLIEFFNDDPRQEYMVASLYDLLRIPYTGASPFTLALCQRKAPTKHLLLANGIRTPRFRVMNEGQFLRRHGLHYPLIVKPVREDASVGIDNASVVESFDLMSERVHYIWKEFKQPALVEEYIDGRELHVPILGNYPPKVLPIAEMDFSGLPPHLHNILSYDAKWDPNNEAYQKLQLRCPADLPKRVEKKIREVALATYNTLGCRDYARIDLRLTKRNQPYVLEVNPNPDLSEDDVFMQAAKKAGLSSVATLRKIVELALRRTPRQKSTPQEKALASL